MRVHPSGNIRLGREITLQEHRGWFHLQRLLPVREVILAVAELLVGAVDRAWTPHVLLRQAGVRVVRRGHMPSVRVRLTLLIASVIASTVVALHLVRVELLRLGDEVGLLIEKFRWWRRLR